MLHTINRMDCPDFYVEVVYRGSPRENIAGRRIRDELERWLRGISFEEVRSQYEAGDFAAAPSRSFEEQGVLLTFTPIPRGPGSRGNPEVRPIGVVAPEGFHELRSHDDIRAAVEGKATKYGPLGLPLVVAVNVMADLCDERDALNGLFGEEIVVASRRAEETWDHRWGLRKPNGAWYGPRGPKNRPASAAALAYHLSPSELRSFRLELFHNPWAERPLSPDALPFRQCEVLLDDGGRVQWRDGTHPADLLGIPERWPIPD